MIGQVIIVQVENDTIAVPLIYIEVFLLMLTSFLIGYFLAFYSYKSKGKNKLIKKKIELIEADSEYLEEELEEQEVLIASEETEVKTYSKNKAGALNFERIGTAAHSESDDLQKIIGIGPYTEEKLNTIGIYTFEQISKFNDEDIELVTELIQFFPDRIKNDNWVSKAKMLHESKKRNQLRREGPHMKRA